MTDGATTSNGLPKPVITMDTLSGGIVATSTSSSKGAMCAASTDEVNKPLTANAVMSMSIAPTTGGRGESDANAGLIAGVVVGVVLAVVMVVMAAIVLAVCSVRWRRNKKYALSCNVTYDVPYDAYIGEFAKY